jgi:hypothetical protein
LDATAQQRLGVFRDQVADALRPRPRGVIDMDEARRPATALRRSGAPGMWRRTV